MSKAGDDVPVGMRQTLATGVVARTDPGDDVAELPPEDGAAPVVVVAEPRPAAGAAAALGVVVGPVVGWPAVEGVKRAARPPTGAGSDGPVDGARRGLAAAVTGASTVATGPGTGPGKPTA
jgi:hypothetical protein